MGTHRMGEIFVSNCFTACHIKYTRENGFCERSVVISKMTCPQKNSCPLATLKEVE